MFNGVRTRARPHPSVHHQRPTAGAPAASEPGGGAYTVEGAGRCLGGIGRTTVYGLIAAGKLEAVKLGSRTLVTAASIEALLAEPAARAEEAWAAAERHRAVKPPLSPPPGDRRHLLTVELARRWHMSHRTLEQWRWKKVGPRYLKIGGRVLYCLEDIEEYEAAHRREVS